MRTRPLYVAVIPSWLAEVLNRAGKPLEAAMDFATLETIVSLDDVCFYVDHLRNQKVYVGELFDDMVSIARHPNNVSWLAAKAGQIESRVEATRRFYADTTLDLTTPQIPRVVRKTNYVPTALRDDCLAIIGVGSDTAKEFDLTKFVRSTMDELKKLRNWDEVVHFKVFKTFTQVATDAA